MPIKLINIGESGTGKTGALASLCGAGFNVRVLDLDNGVEALCNLLSDASSKYPKGSAQRLRWKTLTERMRVLNSQIVPQAATVYPRAVDMLESWKGDRALDPALGIVEATAALKSVYTWTGNDILVVDSLTKLAEAAVNHKLMMEGKLGTARSGMEGMRDAGSAQVMIDKFLNFMADDNLRCHVIVNTHVNWAKEDGKVPEMGYEGPRFAFPSAIGNALNTKIARGFNHLLMTRSVGVEKRIYTRGVANVALKSGAPLRVKESYPLATGLADYFSDVGAKPSKEPT